ncbi:tRNA lysidine(34) synthetase TilS [Hippea maritima]|uniref:tRNA(Ile)-lysidine synthase n=1 Tax=Hippea maritima (strain ATCC 700847 / DSM 10411 / MH2) TaxID=760142 RepID=F2LTR0_HIPMA|nr:tRNA lysidine(34) synthetase TilS [Hippea maritima]AEA34436.1 tRNA(Ile)-lysidine synthase [Hippea maritima DSM 10411]
MDEHLKKLEAFAKEHKLLSEKLKIGVAVSGGPDSVFMLMLLNTLAQKYTLELAVLHFNHKLREEAEDEEIFVGKLASSLGLKFLKAEYDVGAFSRQNKLSIEDGARRKRYEFFYESKTKLNLDVIATGHTKDDVAETLLMNLIRGSSTDGLSSLKPKRGFFIRPILCFEKQEILNFLNKNNIQYKIDNSNADTYFKRNKIRAELLPLLKNINPNIVDTLFRSSLILAEDSSYLKKKAEVEFIKSTKITADKVIIDINNINTSKAILKRVLNMAIKRLLNSEYNLSFRNTERLTKVFTEDKNLSLRKLIKAYRKNDKLIIEKL